MPRKRANCYIIAGSNGAGKTTFAMEFLPLYANCRNFINPDLLARAYSPFDPDAGMVRAGRTVLERIKEFTAARQDFAFETTLSGRTYFPLLQKVKKAGFRLHMFYLWIPSLNWLCCASATVSKVAAIMSQKKMFADASGGHCTIFFPYTVPCSTRSVSLTILRMSHG